MISDEVVSDFLFPSAEGWSFNVSLNIEKGRENVPPQSPISIIIAEA